MSYQATEFLAGLFGPADPEPTTAGQESGLSCGRLPEPSAVWREVLCRLEQEEAFPPGVAKALREATVSWGHRETQGRQPESSEG